MTSTNDGKDVQQVTNATPEDATSASDSCCCPPDALPYLTSGGVAKGTKIDLGNGVQVYQAAEGGRTDVEVYEAVGGGRAPGLGF